MVAQKNLFSTLPRTNQFGTLKICSDDKKSPDCEIFFLPNFRSITMTAPLEITLNIMPFRTSFSRLTQQKEIIASLFTVYE